MATQIRPAENDTGPDLTGLAMRRRFQETGRDLIFTEIGTVGLDISGGRVRESRLQNFKGINRAKVIREMAETDAIVKGLLSNYKMLALAAERRVTAASDAANDQEAADFVEECLDDMEISWNDTLSGILSMLEHGHSWHEQNFKLRQGQNPPPMIVEDVKTGDTREEEAPTSKFDDGRIGWAGWPIRLQETLDRFDFTDNGRVKGVFQRPKSFKHGEVFIPVEKSLHFRTSAKRGDPLGESMLECTYRAWYFKRNFEELMGIGVKRDATGAMVMSVPKAWNIWAASESGRRQELEDLIANFQRDEYEGIVAPEDVKFELLQAGGQRQFDITDLLRQLWLEIAIATLTDFALVGHEQIGARSLKEEAARIFLVALQGILDSVAEIINRFAIPRLVELNGFSVTAFPEIAFSAVDVPEVKDIIESLVKLAGAGAEVFPNREVTEAIFGMLKLPIEELGENIEDAEERRDEMMKNNPLFGQGGPPQSGEEEDDAEDGDDDEDDDEQ